ncbi:MAG: hypothetical protein V4591_12205 [Bdellovibrionota bacterium]
MKKIRLFLNGSFELSTFKLKINNTLLPPQSSPKNDEHIDYYAADGGLNHLLKHKIPFSSLCWVGDSDSLNKKSALFLEKNNSIKKIKRLNPKKNFSDLAAILDLILEQNIEQNLFIEIFGGLGKRRDHETANIEEIKRFLSLLPKGGTALFHGGLVITTLPIKILETNCQFFSVFANSGAVDIKGALYSGHFTLQRPSHGLSNEKINETLSITPQSGGMVSLYIEG